MSGGGVGAGIRSPAPRRPPTGVGSDATAAADDDDDSTEAKWISAGGKETVREGSRSDGVVVVVFSPAVVDAVGTPEGVVVVGVEFAVDKLAEVVMEDAAAAAAVLLEVAAGDLGMTTPPQS